MKITANKRHTSIVIIGCIAVLLFSNILFSSLKLTTTTAKSESLALALQNVLASGNSGMIQEATAQFECDPEIQSCPDVPPPCNPQYFSCPVPGCNPNIQSCIMTPEPGLREPELFADLLLGLPGFIRDAITYSVGRALLNCIGEAVTLAAFDEFIEELGDAYERGRSALASFIRESGIALKNAYCLPF